jgi:tetratricopeptide (TPR) repeat protein
MIELDACPLCRSVLPAGADSCPDCGADLAPYHDIDTLAKQYLKLGREMLSRGEVAAARNICDKLPQLGGAADDELLELQARVALAERDIAAVEATLPALTAETATVLSAELKLLKGDIQLARELYNHALSSLRDGAFIRASRMLKQACVADPGNAQVWVLLLKAGLKLNDWHSCYLALGQLDHLAARPPEFRHIEELLPPIT